MPFYKIEIKEVVMKSILKTTNLSFSYDKIHPVLQDINLEFSKGVVYGIFGKSGAGKSTLLSLLAGLEKIEAGCIFYQDKDLARCNLDYYRSHDIGIVFQAYNLLSQLTAIENVVLSIELNHPKEKNKEEKAKALLKKVGIREDLMKHKILKLSGGEQQRVAIARALSYDADVILADEPTGNLDSDTEDDIINLFLDIAHKEDKCVIIISHSREVKKHVDICYHLVHGKITA